MKHPLKLLSGVLFLVAISATLFFLLPESPVPTESSNPAETTAGAKSIGAVETEPVAEKSASPAIEPPADAVEPVDQSQDSENKSDSLEDYAWIPDPKIKGGIRVVTNQNGQTVEFVGTHMLAKLAPGATEEKLASWLRENKAGSILENRNGLLKIQPNELSLESFLQLKADLEAAPAELLTYAEPDYLYHTMDIPNDPGFENFGAWYFEEINAGEAWDLRTDASDVIVAILDTGMSYDIEEFSGNIWQGPESIGYDWVNGDKFPLDDNGHGTSVAGVIGARANNGIGVAGIAWSVQLMPVKVLGDDGYGTASDISSGIYWAINNGADIINLSLGGAESNALEESVIAADTAGVILVCAAGNYGNDVDIVPEYPAAYDYPHVVQVGASNVNNRKAGFSNYGQNLIDVFAPGDDITVLQVRPDKSVYTNDEDGTSFAAPIVSGTLALILQEFPGEMPAAAIQRMLDAAVYHESLNGFSRRGTVVNLKRSLEGYRPMPPIVEWEMNPLAVDYGEYLTLTPFIQADGSITVSWKFNDNQIESLPDSLSFNPFEPDDTGSYTLTVTSKYGTTISEPLIISGNPVPPEITYLTESFSTTPGNEVQLKVTVDHYTPDPVRIDWYKQGTAEPYLENSSRLSIIADESAVFFAHITSPYGEVTTDLIQVTVISIDWTENLNPATPAFYEPFGTLLESQLALEPAYWTIQAPFFLDKVYSFDTGAYYFRPDTSQLERIDREGNFTTSDLTSFEGSYRIQVVGGYVTFPKAFTFTEVLSPELEVLPGSRGGKWLLAIKELDGWFYELFHDNGTGKNGFRRTQDFYNYEVLIDDVPGASDHFLSYTLELARGVACIGTHTRHLWHPDTGLSTEEITGQVWSHEGTLYRITRIDGLDYIYAHDPSAKEWLYYSPATESDELKVGRGSPVRERGSIKEIFDGEEWIGVWTDSNTLPKREIFAATDSSFYALPNIEAGEDIFRSEDGFNWEYVGYSIVDENFYAATDEFLVLIEGLESVWIDESIVTRKPLVFMNGVPSYAWTSLEKIGPAYFLWATVSWYQSEVFISLDMEHWKLTDLAFPPVRLKERDDGIYEGLLSQLGTAIPITSNDLITWERGESYPTTGNEAVIEFSLGMIRGNQFSEDGVNWVQLPFGVEKIVETRNRIFFFDGGGAESFTDKTDVLGAPVAEFIPEPYLKSGKIPLLGELAEYNISLGSLLPTSYRGLDFFINYEWVGHATTLPVILEYTPVRYQSAILECVVDYDGQNIRKVTLGQLAPHPLSPNVAKESSFAEDFSPTEWKKGWLTLGTARVLYSTDKVNWSPWPGAVNPFWSAYKVLVLGEKWLLLRSAAVVGPALSEDQGKTWVGLDDAYSTKIYDVIENTVAVSTYNGGSYSTNLQDWHPLPDIAGDKPKVIHEAGNLFYLNLSGGLTRLDIATGTIETLEDGTAPLTLGEEAYIKRSFNPSTKWTVHSLQDGTLLGELPYNENTWNHPSAQTILTAKDDHWIMQYGSLRYSGVFSSMEIEQEEVNFQIYSQPSKDGADIGPRGLKILAINELEWQFRDGPVTHVAFELFNADTIPLSRNEGLRVQLEWIDPGNGEVVHTSERTLDRFIANESGIALEMEFPAPRFTDDIVLDAKLTLLPDMAGKLHGQYSREIKGIQVRARANLNIALEGNGKLSFAEQGPFSVGMNVHATAIEGELYSFGQWISPVNSASPTQSITLSDQNDLKIIFLPHSVAAINRWSRQSYTWLSEWYGMPSAPEIYFSQSGWAHSDPTGWLITTAVDDSLYSWSPDFGWTCTQTGWYPYHWSYQMNDWVYFEQE